VIDNPPANCVPVTGPWVSVGPDASRGWTLNCPSGTEVRIVQIGLNNYGVDADYNRDHWTITAWTTTGTDTSQSFEGHNWNTVFGDTWHYQPLVACVPPGSAAARPPRSFGSPNQGTTFVREVGVLAGRTSTASLSCPGATQLLGSSQSVGQFARRPARVNDGVRVRHRESRRGATARFTGPRGLRGRVRGQLRVRCGRR
jgi:hypothetical protein